MANHYREDDPILSNIPSSKRKSTKGNILDEISAYYRSIRSSLQGQHVVIIGIVKKRYVVILCWIVAISK